MEVTAYLPAYQPVGQTKLCTWVPILELLDRRQQWTTAGAPASVIVQCNIVHMGAGSRVTGS
eukprot:359069-Chlamydomonas_euryale.AAC.3